jgi:hypothetical protein
MNYFEEGQPTLRKSYCVFMDVLGFSEMISSSSGAHNEISLFQRYYDVTTDIIDKLNEHAEDDSILQLKMFSDNIVLALPWFSHDGESEFGFILSALSEYQLSMALNGFFVRGGLSVGNLFVNENMIYGNALLEAYELESKQANDPKIILSDDVLRVLRSHTQFYSNPEHSPQNSDVIIDTDGKGFINYLDQLIYEDGEGFCIDRERLVLHKIKIIEAVELHRENPKIWYKYHWLCDYHNYFCLLVSEMTGYTSDCLIPTEIYKRELRRLV